MRCLQVYLLKWEEDATVDITKIVSKGINNYYDSLSILGYRPQSDIDKLIVLMFIEEVLTQDMRIFVTEEDYKVIDKALNCLYGDCLVPFPQYKAGKLSSFTDGGIVSPRITEGSNIRVTEDNNVRFRS